MKAKNLLADPRYKESIEKLGEELFNTWINTSMEDVDTREQSWLSLKLLERISQHLTSIVESGEMAEKIKELNI
jgi:hypothetical protein